MFTIYDQIHCDYAGTFETKSAGLTELDRLSKLPWDQVPNVAPCTAWRTCGRKWKLIEYDGIVRPLDEDKVIATAIVESPLRKPKLARNRRGLLFEKIIRSFRGLRRRY